MRRNLHKLLYSGFKRPRKPNKDFIPKKQMSNIFIGPSYEAPYPDYTHVMPLQQEFEFEAPGGGETQSLPSNRPIWIMPGYYSNPLPNGYYEIAPNSYEFVIQPSITDRVYFDSSFDYTLINNPNVKLPVTTKEILFYFPFDFKLKPGSKEFLQVGDWVGNKNSPYFKVAMIADKKKILETTKDICILVEHKNGVKPSFLKDYFSDDVIQKLDNSKKYGFWEINDILKNEDMEYDVQSFEPASQNNDQNINSFFDDFVEKAFEDYAKKITPPNDNFEQDIQNLARKLLESNTVLPLQDLTLMLDSLSPTNPKSIKILQNLRKIIVFDITPNSKSSNPHIFNVEDNILCLIDETIDRLQNNECDIVKYHIKLAQLKLKFEQDYPDKFKQFCLANNISKITLGLLQSIYNKHKKDQENYSKIRKEINSITDFNASFKNVVKELNNKVSKDDVYLFEDLIMQNDAEIDKILLHELDKINEELSKLTPFNGQKSKIYIGDSLEDCLKQAQKDLDFAKKSPEPYKKLDDTVKTVAKKKDLPEHIQAMYRVLSRKLTKLSRNLIIKLTEKSKKSLVRSILKSSIGDSLVSMFLFGMLKQIKDTKYQSHINYLIEELKIDSFTFGIEGIFDTIIQSIKSEIDKENKLEIKIDNLQEEEENIEDEVEELSQTEDQKNHLFI